MYDVDSLQLIEVTLNSSIVRGPNGLALSDDFRYLFVADYRLQTLIQFDLVNRSLIRNFPSNYSASQNPNSVAYIPQLDAVLFNPCLLFFHFRHSFCEAPIVMLFPNDTEVLFYAGGSFEGISLDGDIVYVTDRGSGIVIPSRSC